MSSELHIYSVLRPPPAFPKLPFAALFPKLFISRQTAPPPVEWQTRNYKCDDDHGLQWLCKDRSAEQEQADATKDDWCRDPAFVRTLQVGLFDS